MRGSLPRAVFEREEMGVVEAYDGVLEEAEAKMNREDVMPTSCMNIETPSRPMSVLSDREDDMATAMMDRIDWMTKHAEYEVAEPMMR